MVGNGGYILAVGRWWWMEVDIFCLMVGGCGWWRVVVDIFSLVVGGGGYILADGGWWWVVAWFSLTRKEIGDTLSTEASKKDKNKIKANKNIKV